MRPGSLFPWKPLGKRVSRFGPLGCFPGWMGRVNGWGFFGVFRGFKGVFYPGPPGDALGVSPLGGPRGNTVFPGV